MLKSQLIQRIMVLNPELPELVCRTLVITFFDAIIDRLADGGDIELRGFGRFFLSPYAERTVRNPQNGATSLKTAYGAVRFRTGKALRAQLNAKPRNRLPGLSNGLDRERKQNADNRSGFHRPGNGHDATKLTNEDCDIL
jgi:integration host factor subunit beta